MSNRRSLLILSLAAALLSPLAAQADQTPSPGFVPSGPSKTRAQVQAELETARQNPVQADGWRDFGGFLQYVGHAGSGRSRAEVQAELAAFRQNPVHPDGWRLVGGDQLVFVGHAGPGRSRAEALAELEAWRQNPVSHDGYREFGSESIVRVSPTRDGAVDRPGPWGTLANRPAVP